VSSNGNEPIQTHLNIIEPAQRCIKTFNTFEEFDTWYFKHKHRVDSQTTHILNKMYSIPGYRITKIKGVLSLKRLTKKGIFLNVPEGYGNGVPRICDPIPESEQMQALTLNCFRVRRVLVHH